MSLKIGEVVDNNQWHRFELPVDDDKAIIDYSREGNVYNLMHTEVPSQFEGQGVAKILVEKTFAFLEANQFLIRPYCPYILTYLKRHPEWQKLVTTEAE